MKGEIESVFFLTALMRSSAASVYCALYETHLANNKMKELTYLRVLRSIWQKTHNKKTDEKYISYNIELPI